MRSIPTYKVIVIHNFCDNANPLLIIPLIIPVSTLAVLLKLDVGGGGGYEICHSHADKHLLT